MQRKARINRRLLLYFGVTALFLHRKVPGQGTGLVREGDVLVYARGPKADQPIALPELAEGKMVLAFPMDRQTGLVKKETKALIVLVKLERASAAQAKGAVGGLVAFSALCPHQGCPVEKIGEVGSRKGKLICNCHGSYFDPLDGGKVLGGPAPRGLAPLPIRLEGQLVVAAGDFLGKVGP
ncbi:ubiquinol-cytochrome c reductase iron-sulfur subunit [Klebsiella pneumoniae]|uniref:QcrA and Rieske domain-containing protein n=1 Tax=Klebsiella pneumoniae TaxID=573 RepID=UPI003B5A307F